MGNINVVNLIATGKIPFKHPLKIDEIKEIINNGSFSWDYDENKRTPKLSFKILKEKKNSFGKPKSISFSMSVNGHIFVVGGNKKSEIEDIYNKVYNDLKYSFPGLIDD